MVTKQSNNQITNIPTFCVGERGENFCFDGACERLMACLGETDYTYWLIAGITGDCFAQVYPKHSIFYSDRYCVSDYHILYDEDCSAYIEGIFDTLGYACTYVPKAKILANKEMYRQTLMAYVDKGIPVIEFKGNYSLICGYEEHGDVLLHKLPGADSLERFTPDDTYFADNQMKGWIFVGEKKEQKDLAALYRDAVNKMAEIMTTETNWYTFGAGAFRAWAEDIENGFYDGKTPDMVDLWGTHTSFVCDFETISAKAWVFLSKALELNPDMHFIPEIIQILRRQGEYANGGLEDLGGGFNVTLAALQDGEKRKAITERLRLFAANMDKVVAILNQAGIQSAAPAEAAPQAEKPTKEELERRLKATAEQMAPPIALETLEPYGNQSSTTWYKMEEGALAISSIEDDHFVETEAVYSLPLRIDMTAKTNDTNIRLYFGPGEVIFNWECNKSELRVHDPFDGGAHGYADAGLVQPGEYADITWILGEDAMEIYVDGQLRHRGTDYPYLAAIKEAPIQSAIRISSAFGSTVHVRSLTITPMGKEPEEIDLNTLRAFQPMTYQLTDEALSMCCQGDNVGFVTPEKYKLPLRVDLTAKTDATNIRLYYGSGEVIFNWECNPTELRVHDPLTGQPYGIAGAGGVPTDTFVDISWVLERDGMAIYVDGRLRHMESGYSYIPWLAGSPENTLCHPVRITTAFGSTVTVKKLCVTELK